MQQRHSALTDTKIIFFSDNKPRLQKIKHFSNLNAIAARIIAGMGVLTAAIAK